MPTFVNCVTDILDPFIHAATKLGIGENLIRTTAATLLAAAKIPKEKMILDIEARKLGAKEAKATEMVKTYDNAISILKDLPDIKKITALFIYFR